MPIRPCPRCEQPSPRWLESPSAIAHVNYYRCDVCGHVWHVPKDQPDAEPVVVATGRDVAVARRASNR